jgi:DNA-binding GntR family transcriptional regulator
MDVGPVQHAQLWEAVAERLRTAILGGEFAPGAKLIETELAARFGTSRGPVREAIRELAREGLVLELPRRGTVVATFTQKDLAEVYVVREALEKAASSEVVAQATDDELRQLGARVDAIEASPDYLEAASHDLEFHRMLVSLSRNVRLAAMYEQMLAQTSLLLRTAAETTPTLRSGMRRSAHQDIVDALLARDGRRAEHALAAHYAYARERLFGALDA